MPTGYTAPVEDGTVTELKDFAAQCAHAFGAFVHQREERSDSALRYPDPPNESYYHEAYYEALQELNDWKNATEEEKYAQWSDYYNRTLVSHAETRARIQQNNSRYNAMLAKVHAVDVPSELQNFKDFMVQQLQISLTNDSDDWYNLLEYVEWCDMKDKETKRRVDYARQSLNEEIKRYDSRCGYIDLLSRTYGIEVEK